MRCGRRPQLRRGRRRGLRCRHRDSKDSNGPALNFTSEAFAAFVSAAARGEFHGESGQALPSV
ncbi:DUF397 domain-containing protein [Streptomyces sp. NPDC002055]|uniref:DUF397 domain-containing protein n=1 Tax=Streptomyces sp. NPDC002055 TaxID=3154534 RepID=UPI00331A716F